MECRRERDRERSEQRWAAAHAGHEIVINSVGRRRCVTCSLAWRSAPVTDQDAVDRVVSGMPPEPMRPADRAAAVLELDARGLLSAQEIAVRVGCSARTVVRIRAARRAGLIGGAR
ncbi:helix-turn-helix domain-containing protein [Streptomyces xiamenensis]|uniref:helix-turn-helix domain-containing protein n=1 Tax=Streptomyces xiamenensis TaxID=408015 RepID=UPI003D70D928